MVDAKRDYVYVAIDRPKPLFHVAPVGSSEILCGVEILDNFSRIIQFPRINPARMQAFKDVCPECDPPVEQTEELNDGDAEAHGPAEVLNEGSLEVMEADSEPESRIRGGNYRAGAHGEAGETKEAMTTQDEELNEHSLALVTGLDQAYMALKNARSDFERLRIRDQARAAVAAAAILKRRDIQTEASVLVAIAEREIAKANPPTPPEERSPGRGGNTVNPDNDIPDAVSGEVVRQIRQAHGELTDEQFEAVTEKARESNEPLTRTVLKREARKLNPPADEDHEERDEPKPPTRTERLEAEREAMFLEVGPLRQEKDDLQMRVNWFEAQKSDYDVDHYKRVNDQQAEIRTLQGRLNRLTNEKEEARRQVRYWKSEAMKLGWKESRGSLQPELNA